HSPIFHPTHGFGGNGGYNKTMNDALLLEGRGTFWGGNCVETGPFANWTLHVAIGRDFFWDPKCLRRNLAESSSQWVWRDKEEIVFAQEGFGEMQKWLEGHGMEWLGLHGGGHMVVGGLPRNVGSGTDPWTSTLEPLFYLHHANVD